MQVLEILKTNARDLYPEDLAFFEAELDTGDYSPEYIDQCKDLIAEIRNQRKQVARCAVQDVIPSGMLVDANALIPDAPTTKKSPQVRLTEIIHNLAQMRTATNYKTRFKQYLSAHPEMDEAFIDQHSALFQPSELESILMVMPLSEAFLEKYFASLDAETVLTKGKNEWRKKENRSSQLDVFLRLKGVGI